MLTVEQAIMLVARYAAKLPAVRMALGDALGLVLAESVASDIDSPPHNKAMMDGFAVVASDRSPTRVIIESVMAGDVPHHAVRPGAATRIMTGAPVPDGATAVIPIEKTSQVDEQTVRIDWIDPPVGKHITLQGSSLRVGHQVAEAGTTVSSLVAAALTEAGAGVVQVIRRPKVAILATGNELVSTDLRPGPGQIRNSNGPLLVGAVVEAGATPLELPVGRDDRVELTQLVERGLEADVLLVTGGVSAGAKDLVPEALVAAGVQKVFHKLALKPGKPLWFGIAPRPVGPSRLVFGFPGNPVSGLACFHLFVRPALAVLSGRMDTVRLELARGRAADAYAHGGGRETFRPARAMASIADEVPMVEFIRWHGSADLAGAAKANCLVRLPVEPLTVSSGDEVAFLPL